jgi:hypothetical protein
MLMGTQMAENCSVSLFASKESIPQSLDALGQVMNVTLWTPDFKYIEVVGSLKSDPQFSIPATSSAKFAAFHATARINEAASEELASKRRVNAS